MIAVIVASCGDDNGTGPYTLKFGLSGGITIQLETPLRLGSGTPRVGAGTLSQRLEWQSTGAWSLFEQISYRDLVGDETLWRSAGDPFIYVASYVGLINTVSSAAGLELFIPEMDTLASPRIVTCGEGRTHITFSISIVERPVSSSVLAGVDSPQRFASLAECAGASTSTRAASTWTTPSGVIVRCVWVSAGLTWAE